ncbi:MAG: carbamoyl-phosphate synthase large subunit, partial [Actinomycetota bacterium]
PGTSGVLGTQMQSVGEAMAIGRTFTESLQKALRSLEIGRLGLNCDPGESAFASLDDAELLEKIAIPTPDRVFQVGECLRRKMSIDMVAAACKFDPWFLDQMAMIVEEREHIQAMTPTELAKSDWSRVKRLGFADAQLAWLWGTSEADVRKARIGAGVIPTYKAVDTCSAEFAAQTPYHYSTYEDENEIHATTKESVVILGSGPNRIGQGIEFDYCCVHASFALRDAGYETIMLNCNPETVSTDYDTSDKLYFEPLTHEDVMNVIDAETKASGVAPKVIVGLGGQTPLKLSAKIPPQLIAGTNSQSIDIAEDREKWSALCASLGIAQPPGGTARDLEQAIQVAEQIGYPVLVRPSYVLGGRAMQIVHDRDHLQVAMHELGQAGSLGKEGGVSAERPVLIDRFLEDAIEVDVDAIRDSSDEVLIGGVMEHVEQAGVHSGDSACAIPPASLGKATIDEIESTVVKIAKALQVVGLINVQFAVAGSKVFVIEANPRASRTVPFVAKATGVPLVKVASRVMLGASLAELRTEGLLNQKVGGSHVSVKEAVLPFNRFAEVDTALGPEMRSTGEVMGIDDSFARAFVKAQFAAGTMLPQSGLVFVSLNDRDKSGGVEVVNGLTKLGLQIAATSGTAKYLTDNGCQVARVVRKFSERGSDPALVDDAVKLIEAGEIVLVINTPRGHGTRSDGEAIRKAANNCRVPVVTTLSAATAAVQGMLEHRDRPFSVMSLQEFHGRK